MNFQEQSVKFIAEIGSRKRNPAKPSTVASYQNALDCHILPDLGSLDLSKVENGVLKSFVAKLAGKGLAPATISRVVAVVKSVVSAAVDANGNELFPRKWNNDFIDLPVIQDQKAPTVSPDRIQTAIGEAIGQDKALIALLAGTGLRIGEALALTSEDWDQQNMTISVTKTVSLGEIQNSTKTAAGKRTVDLSPELNQYLQTWIGQPEPQKPLFQSETGGVYRRMTAYEHLAKVGVPGFHSLRRFRVTRLRKTGVPEGLVKFWTGHADKSITDLYDRIGEDVEARKDFTKKAGLGFRLGAA